MAINVIISVVIGLTLSIVSITIATLIAIKNKKNVWEKFYRNIVLSMSIRILFISVISYLLIKFSSIQYFSFLISLFVSYFIGIIFEIIYIHKISLQETEKQI